MTKATLSVLRQTDSEPQLDETDERLRRIYADAPIGIAVTDAQGRFIKCNPVYARLVGRTEDELRSIAIEELIHSDDRKSKLDQIAKLRAGEISLLKVEHCCIDAKGNPISVQKLLSAQRDPSGQFTGFLALVSDISEQIIARQRLRESKERFRTMADGLPHMIWVHDAEGQLQFVNRTYCEYFNVDTESMHGGEWQKLIHPEDAEGYTREFLDCVRELRSFHAEARVKNAAGEWRSVESWARPLFSSAGEFLGFVGASVDITDRKDADRNRARMWSILRALFENTTDLIYVKDLEGRLQAANSALCDFLGKPLGELIGQSDLEWGGDSPYTRAVIENDRKIITSGSQAALEEVFPSPDGVPHIFHSAKACWHDERGTVCGLVGVSRDITDRKSFESELEYQRSILKAVTDNAETAIFLINPEGVGLFVNPAAEEMTGFASDELVGKLLHDLIHHKRRDGTQFPISECPLDSAVARSKSVRGVEDYFLHKSGRFFPVRYNARPVFRDGQLVATVIEAWDITEEIEGKQRLKEAQRQLEQHAANLEKTVAERTASLRETITEMEALSYSISHDMRAPLRAMQGFSIALLEDYGERLDAEGKEHLARIARAAERMDALIQDILNYSRVAKGDLALEPLDLEQVVSDTVEHYHPDATGLVAVVKPLDPVSGNQAFLIQVLSNLIGNALKFQKAEGKPKVLIRSERLGAKVKVTVQDNGVGIDPVHFKRLFTIFGRIHGMSEYPGTGIGLAIVKRAVERMGGEVGVESVLGEGASFWFTLPAP